MTPHDAAVRWPADDLRASHGGLSAVRRDARAGGRGDRRGQPRRRPARPRSAKRTSSPARWGHSGCPAGPISRVSSNSDSRCRAGRYSPTASTWRTSSARFAASWTPSSPTGTLARRSDRDGGQRERGGDGGGAERRELHVVELLRRSRSARGRVGRAVARVRERSVIPDGIGGARRSRDPRLQVVRGQRRPVFMWFVAVCARCRAGRSRR